MYRLKAIYGRAERKHDLHLNKTRNCTFVDLIRENITKTERIYFEKYIIIKVNSLPSGSLHKLVVPNKLKPEFLSKYELKRFLPTNNPK